VTDCPACADYTRREHEALDAAGYEHRASLAEMRRNERLGSVPGPWRWPDGWTADAATWTAPDPTHGTGRA
jgi:hypothetical protein